MDNSTKKWLQIKLRELTLQWSGRNECLKNAKVKVKVGKYKNGNTKYLNHYRCAKCDKLYILERVNVDHIVEVGSASVPLGEWIEKLYCPVDNLQVLCLSCHSRKTANFCRSRRDIDLV